LSKNVAAVPAIIYASIAPPDENGAYLPVNWQASVGIVSIDS
jgi:hypothetical protein